MKPVITALSRLSEFIESDLPENEIIPVPVFNLISSSLYCNTVHLQSTRALSFDCNSILAPPDKSPSGSSRHLLSLLSPRFIFAIYTTSLTNLIL